MKTKLLTPFNFIRDIVISIVTAIAAGGPISSYNLWCGIFVAIFIVIVGAIYLVFKKYERLIKAIWSGVQGYYYSFPPEENLNIWQNHNVIKYLGISAYTILPHFKAWVERLPSNSNTTFEFLLMSPDAKAIKKQLLYEKGIDDPSLIADDEVEAMRSRIRACIQEIKACRNKNIRIKIYDEFVPWWMYVLDDKEVYLGLLPKGQSGIASPLMMMKKLKNYTTLFDSFCNTWNRMWDDAVSV